MNDKKFVIKWIQAFNEDKTLQWIADQLGITYGNVNTRAYQLRRKGVVLPKLRRQDKEHTVNQLNQLIKEKAWVRK